MNGKSVIQATVVLLLLPVLLFGCSGGDSSTEPTKPFSKVSFPLTVRAEIDGKSQLLIQGSEIWWRHIEWEPPGMWEGDLPTQINSQDWFPGWPSGVLTDCNCDSSKLDALDSPIRADNTPIALANTMGRGTIVITQQPSSANNYTAIIEFNDVFAGAEWHEVTIEYF